MPWSPLKSGFLSGKYSGGTRARSTLRAPQLVGRPERDYDVIDALERVAAEMGASPAAVALAWVQSRPDVTSTLVGARRIDQLLANFAALDITLSARQRAVSR